MDVGSYTFEPLALAQRVIRRWPVAIVFSIAGGLLGLLFSIVRPPVYQADAVMAINIDYGRTMPLGLIVEDRALSRVWQFITSDEVLQAVRNDLQGEFGEAEAWTDLPGLRSRLRLEQRLADWHLIARDRDPGMASAMANAWADSVMAQLDEAYQHAWRAAALQGSPFDVSCLQLVDPVTLESWTECLAHGPAISPELIEELLSEVRASRGILPALSFEWIRRAEIPEEPVVWDRGLLVLAGAALGLLAGLTLTATLPKGVLEKCRPVGAVLGRAPNSE